MIGHLLYFELKGIKKSCRKVALLSKSKYIVMRDRKDSFNKVHTKQALDSLNLDTTVERT